MAAPVRVEAAALSDPRIDLLGQLAGYSRYEALGRLTHLWSACTEKQFHVATEALVRACIGPAGVQHMLDAELAERVDGGLRVKGTAGRIEWHGEFSQKRAAAGAVRAATAQRDSKGRMVSSTPPAHPAHAGQDAEPAPVDIQHTSTRPAHAGHAGPSTSSTHQQASSACPAESSALTLTITTTTTEEERERGVAAAPLAALKAKVNRGVRAARKGPMPTDWLPRAQECAQAAAIGANADREAASFRDHHAAKGSRFVDWDAAFRNWLRNAERFAVNRPADRRTPIEKQLDRVRMLQAQEAAEDAAEGVT